MSKTTTFAVSIGNQTTRVRVKNDALNEFDIPVSADEAENLARDAAIRKLHGSSAFWWPDSGLNGYGQVMRPSRFGGSDSVTNRVGLDVSAETPFPVNEPARKQAASDWNAMVAEQREVEARGFEDGYNGRKRNAELSDNTFEYDEAYAAGADQQREDAAAGAD